MSEKRRNVPAQNCGLGLKKPRNQRTAQRQHGERRLATRVLKKFESNEVLNFCRRNLAVLQQLAQNDTRGVVFLGAWGGALEDLDGARFQIGGGGIAENWERFGKHAGDDRQCICAKYQVGKPGGVQFDYNRGRLGQMAICWLPRRQVDQELGQREQKVSRKMQELFDKWRKKFAVGIAK